MFARRICYSYIVAIVGAVNCSMALASATVNYQGYMYHGVDLGFGSGPVAGGYVIAGAFAPGFVVQDYFDVYGDGFGNITQGHYSAAIADGAFRPIGAGVLTDGFGFFSSSGMTDEPEGTPIYLFGFPTADPDSGIPVGVLATGTHSSFLVPADMGSTSVDASQTDTFVYGVPTVDGFAFVLLPIPEPTSCWLAAVGAIACGIAHRPRRCGQ